MSWHRTGILGAVPSWTCDSCTVSKDGTCSLTINLLGTFDSFSKMQSVARRDGSEQKVAELLQPALEAIEGDCLHSSHNAKEKPVAAPERTFHYDYSRGVKIYSDGEVVMLTDDERLDAVRKDNAERIRNFSPHIGQ